MLIDPEVHKDRHGVVKPLFSVKGVEQLAPVALNNVSRMIAKMNASFDKGLPVDLTRLIRLLTIDTIMVLLFNKNMNLLESEEEEPQFAGTMKMFADNFLVMKHFAILARLSAQIPESWAEKLIPGYVPFRKQSSKWIHDIKNQKKRDGLYVTEEGGRSTYFDLLLDANKSRGYEAFNEEVLIDEALAMCFAGTDTTSFALSLGAYHLVSNPTKLQTLREELDGVPANAAGLLEYRDVRALPYLTAVIKEILRISPPVPGIIPRRVPTTVSSAIGMITHDPALFSEPNSFFPERWLSDDSKDLEKWFLVFSRGSRGCLGQKSVPWTLLAVFHPLTVHSVAYLELYVVLANLFRRFDMTLYKTDETTVQWKESAAARLCNHVKVTVDSVRR
ncbi:hypothetical protein SLS62_005024 [Diatrype stigma]|uniref:Cytochrome P450 n=1 Tax=Diatrype stigma TaxID=117547 RepID=A0AAN9V221_9PEZI